MLVADSLSYADRRVQTCDVLVGCSFAGASTTSTVLPLGPKAIIAHDGGIGRAQAGISGLPLCDRFDIPMAAVAGKTALLSNGNSLYCGQISVVNEAAKALGVSVGQEGREAADRLLEARPGRCIAAPEELDLAVHEVGKVGDSRILARVWLLDLPNDHARDVFALGTHCAAVAAEHAFRWNVKGWIANDAGFAKDDSGIAALDICGAKGMAAASVSVFSALIGDGLSTWRDGIVSAANGPARDQGVVVGMEAGEALARMAATHVQP